MKQILNLFILLSFAMVNAQHMPSIVPPSPEAASLAKFVEMPVSHYTGTPEIAIPLATLNSGNLQVPVTLSYHAKGIQVAEVASRSGTGWTINAGGAITRQIRDLADDSNNGYMNKNYTQSYLTSVAVRKSVVDGDINPDDDIEPDVFFFNFLGNSGKFIFDHTTGLPVLQKSDDILIEPAIVGGTIISWTVTDAAGTKYSFMADDKYTSISKFKVDALTGHQPVEGFDGQVITTWYLRSITTVNNDSVTFNYINENINFYERTGDRIENNTHSSSCHYSYNIMQQHQLSSIESREGKVVFDLASGSREDLNGGRALAGVRLLDRHDNEIKKFTFHYEYKTATNDNVNIQLALVDAAARKRLYLKELWQESPVDILKYKFEYSSVDLPNKHSNSVDNWGYYNGKPNGEYLFSQIFVKDRTVDVNLSEAGMLKKITYPTGGYTEYVYEHNRVKTPTFFSSVLMPANNPGTNRNFGMLNNAPPYVSGAYQDTFTVGGSLPVQAKIDINFMVNPATQPGCLPGVDSADCRFKIQISKLNPITGNYENPEKLLLGEYFKALSSGTYKVKVVPPAAPTSPYNLDHSYWVYIKWVEQEIDESKELLGPGKRIKKISKGDGTTELLTKEFKYTDALGASHGLLFSVPNYYHALRYLPNGAVLISGTRGSRNTPLSAYSNGQLGYTRVIETQVGEGNNGKTEYLFTNYKDTGKFYCFPFASPNDLEWSRGLPLEIAYYSFTGDAYRLEKKIVNKYIFYDSSSSPVSGSSELVDPDPDPNLGEPIENTYDRDLPYLATFRKTRIPIYLPGNYIENHNSNTDPQDPNNFHTSYFLAGRVNLASSTEKDYFYNPGNPNAVEISKSQTFRYDSNEHHQITAKTESTSSTDILTTTYYYLFDNLLSNDPAVLLSLRSKHMFNTVLQTKLSNAVKTLSVEVSKYRDWGSGILAPEFIETAKGEANPETRIRYKRYYSFGHPLELEKENGTTVCYLWGYYNSLPVAKIESMAFADLPSAILTDIANYSNTNNGEAALFTKLSALRNHASTAKAMVTTYTFRPLIGTSSITDPKGDHIHYRYDGFNRLEYVEDKDGNVLSENEYHYRP